MANDVLPDDAQPYIAYYIVCLIDILGQKEALKGWARLPPDGQVTDSLIRALKKTVGTVLSYREFFEKYFLQFGKDPAPTVAFTALPKVQQQKSLRVRDCTVTRQQFSDTFVFYTPITNRHGDISGAALYQVLTAAAATLLIGLARKAPIRGAVTVGAGMEIEPGNFYGPALAEAHQLESKIADYPRIVLSQSAVEFARRTSGFSRDTEIEHVSAAYHEHHVRPLLAEDTDAQVIVDFLGREMHRGLGDMPQFVNGAARAYRFVREEARRFAAAGDKKHADRYAQLQQYMESRLSIWGIAREAAIGKD